MTSRVVEIDPFELPEWLGTSEVVWTAETVLGRARVSGSLAAGDSAHAADLLAVDLAYPEAVIDRSWRLLCHRSWTHGQVALLDVDGRLTLGVPGTAFTADLALQVIGRFALAVGSDPRRFLVALRAG